MLPASTQKQPDEVEPAPKGSHEEAAETARLVGCPSGLGSLIGHES